MFFKNVYHTHTLGDICTYIDAKLIGKTQKPVTMISEFLEATSTGNLNKINFHVPLSGTVTTVLVRTTSLTVKHSEFCSRRVLVYKHRNKHNSPPLTPLHMALTNVSLQWRPKSIHCAGGASTSVCLVSTQHLYFKGSRPQFAQSENSPTQLRNI